MIEITEAHTAEDFLNGQVLLFNKPYGWTSFDLVSKVRSAIRHGFNIKKIKVGHAGTLDPLATGVLIICTGKATKSISAIQELKKEYIAIIEFGKTTPSFDLETQFDNEFPFEHITDEDIQKSIHSFTGIIEQEPPLYSAKQIEGSRAYKHARRGSKKKLDPVKIFIEAIEAIDFRPPELTIKVVCGKGTYIRALANDFGKSLGSGAYLKALERTAIGNYRITDAMGIHDFIKNMNKVKQI